MATEGNSGDNPIVVLIIVLVLVAFGFWSLYKNPPTSITNTNQIPVAVNSEGNPIGPNPNVGIPNVAPLISYADALVKYKDARIQLDNNCQANPNNVTFKNNTNIMIDNRSNMARTVRAGSVFSIKAYDFKIVKLTSASPSTTWYMDCDKSQNVATILIQK